MVTGNLFNCTKHSWPPDEYVSRTTLQLLDFDGGSPPEQAWRKRLNSHATLLKEFSVTFTEAIKMIRLGLRLWSYVRQEASKGRKAPIDPFTRERYKPSASLGVPLGGMGSGSISRGFRGEFKHWQIIPGSCEMSPVMEDQFSIFISREGGNKKYSSVLAPGQHEDIKKFSDVSISSWDWNLSGQHSTYHALFPRAWTVYDGEPDPDLKVSYRQISPFIPHDYRESSLPTSVLVYTLVNSGKERAKVSLLMTWANSIGGVSHLSGGHINEPFIGEDGVSGVLLHHKTVRDYPPVSFAIAACETQNVDVTVLPNFGLCGENCFTAKEMWDTMVQRENPCSLEVIFWTFVKMTRMGHFDRKNFNDGPTVPSSPGDILCAAVSASAWVEPHGKCTVAFALAWRYTSFYGTSERTAVDLVHDALTKYMWWEEEIEKWQSPILKNENLPEWYKFTLFNELYFLVAGGTVWTDGGSPAVEGKPNIGTDQNKSTKPTKKKVRIVSTEKSRKRLVQEHTAIVETQNAGADHVDDEDRKPVPGSLLGHELSECEKEVMSGTLQLGSLSSPSDRENVGRFLYLEGVEYVMWCTYDVHFYASFALLGLFPKIELSIQHDFARAVLSEDKRKVKFMADGSWGIRKVKGAVPHDLRMHDPWHEMNAYNIHDTSRWKDLNPKFVLQVYRDFTATGDMSFGRDVWPAVCAAMEYMEQFDRDGDGLIENDGYPDQTYDTWTVHGISAYCGCLWLASLEAAATMAYHLGDHALSEKWLAKFSEAKPVFEAKPWNGSYFNYDSGMSSNSRSIQADQLAGQWYASLSGLPSLFDDDKIRSALKMIYDFNVMKVGGGRMGAVNGMTPNGKVDESCMQSREIWTGVTYGVAATMILAGMEDEAFTTAEGIFRAGWSEEGFGYWFQTPEGWTVGGHYRSLMYMRPLAIWAMQWALSPPKDMLKVPSLNMTKNCISISMSPLKPRAQQGKPTMKIARGNGCFCRAICPSAG